LRRLIASEDVKNALIFCNRKRDVDILQRSLSRHGLDAAALHGDMPQPKRTETLERFKNGDIRLLVASDVAARGLDIQGLSHVFCFDVPYHAEDYVHRIGRTGRAGRPGRSFMLATQEDGKSVAAIEKLIGRAVPPFAIDGIAAALDAEPSDGRHARRGDHRSGERRHGRASRNDEHRGRRPRRNERPSRDGPRHEPRHVVHDAEVVTFPGPNGRPVAEPRGPVPRQPAPDRGAEPRVVGFGDHLPAFLKRAPRIVAEA
jgi:superfamily II DNA/RNA helicase